jgi:hypothetical protein
LGGGEGDRGRRRKRVGGAVATEANGDLAFSLGRRKWSGEDDRGLHRERRIM